MDFFKNTFSSEVRVTHYWKSKECSQASGFYSNSIEELQFPLSEDLFDYISHILAVTMQPVENTEVRKLKYGNGSTETEVRK